MVAWGYDFYLLVLKVSLYFQHSKIKFVSPRGHEISSISRFQKIMVMWTISIKFKG